MNKSFWQNIKKPFFCSAPMYGVSDEAFRRMLLKYGRPDVFFTEMVSADGLVYMAERAGIDSKQAGVFLETLRFVPEERPIAVQIFGSRPENFYKSALLLRQMGFDGIDINAGCPDKNIEKQGAGASLIKNPGLVKEIIVAVKEGVADSGVSLKTRIGYNANKTEEWVGYLLEQDLDALIIHGRARSQGFGGTADWSAIKKAVELRDRISPRTIIVGNGGIADMKDAKNKFEESGVDGAMVGRALIGNPWFFSDEEKERKDKKIKAILEHLAIFEENFKIKNFDDIKKHLAAYTSGFDGAKELRMELMESKSVEEARKAVAEFGSKS
ncbi:MAG TPA: tRNA-dihydrouridine synthase [Candidatus Colwellbacteria bacterium]|nr:tRNA-dihydrouridine synthase [Candidatus Colwellbacteria bacterium]